jgi:hypothetical protein
VDLLSISVPDQVGRGVPAVRTPEMDHQDLVKKLANLSPPDFQLFVMLIPDSKKAARAISRSAVPDMTADLFRWAESSMGCGIPTLIETYESFEGVQKEPILPPPPPPTPITSPPPHPPR